MPARKTTAPKASRSTAVSPVIKLRITLRYTQPPVWREILLRAEDSLEQLMDAAMATMGWEDCHMHELTAGRQRYRVTRMPLDNGWGDPAMDASEVTVGSVLVRKGSKCRWTYDFGDSWEHEIVVVQTSVDWDGKLPACTDGARACPPEDCGGVPGYENLCDVMKNPKHPEHADLLEWMGEQYDPEAFDAAAANRRL